MKAKLVTIVTHTPNPQYWNSYPCILCGESIRTHKYRQPKNVCLIAHRECVKEKKKGDTKGGWWF